MLKDIFGQEIRAGDTIIRPIFSRLSAHKVVKITDGGNLIVSSFVDKHFHSYYKKWFANRRSNLNIDMHNCKLYISFIPDLMKVDIPNQLDVTKLKTLKQLEEQLNK